MEMQFRQVPPPARAPAFPKGEELGLVRGLRVQVSDHQYRCHQCSRMQPRDSLMVWVPDGVRKGDPVWSVEEACRESAFNGSASGWCLKCAPKTPGAGKVHRVGKAQVPSPDSSADFGIFLSGWLSILCAAAILAGIAIVIAAS